LVLTSVPEPLLPFAFTGALVLTNDPEPELPPELPEPFPPALTGALVLTSDPDPELLPEPELPEPLPALTGALVLINEPDPEDEVAPVPVPPALTGTLVLINVPPGSVPVGTAGTVGVVGTVPVGTVPVGTGTGVAVPPALPVLPGTDVPDPELVEPEGFWTPLPAPPAPRLLPQRPRPWAEEGEEDRAEAASIPSDEAQRTAARPTRARLLKVNIFCFSCSIGESLFGSAGSEIDSHD
jgi:hypothetical protein